MPAHYQEYFVKVGRDMFRNIRTRRSSPGVRPSVQALSMKLSRCGSLCILLVCKMIRKEEREWEGKSGKKFTYCEQN
jgi:hypothetical protein